MILRDLGISGWPAQRGTNSGTVRIHCRFNILHSCAGDFDSVGSLHLRQISECAADLFNSSWAVSANLGAHGPPLTTTALCMFFGAGHPRNTLWRLSTRSTVDTALEI